MIKRIVHFEPELNVPLGALTVVELLEDRDVPIIQTWSANRVDAGIIADTALEPRRHTLRVDERESRALAAREIRITCQDKAWCEVFAARDSPISFLGADSCQTVAKRQRCPHCETGYPGKLPPTKYLASQ